MVAGDGIRGRGPGIGKAMKAGDGGLLGGAPAEVTEARSFGL